MNKDILDTDIRLLEFVNNLEDNIYRAIDEDNIEKLEEALKYLSVNRNVDLDSIIFHAYEFNHRKAVDILLRYEYNRETLEALAISAAIEGDEKMIHSMLIRGIKNIDNVLAYLLVEGHKELYDKLLKYLNEYNYKPDEEYIEILYKQLKNFYEFY